MEKSTKNCKISKKIGISSQILDKIGIQKCENLQSVRHFNKPIFFLFHEKILSGS